MSQLKKNLQVLLVDDDTSYANPIKKYMERVCFKEVHLAKDYETGLESIKNNTYHINFLDMEIPNPIGENNLGGLYLLREMRKINPSGVYIILTGHGIDFARETLYEGADLYITKAEWESELTFAFVDEAVKKAKVNFELDIAFSDDKIERYFHGLIINLPTLGGERRDINFEDMTTLQQNDINIQFELLLMRFFYRNNKVILRKFISGFSGSRTALVCADGRYPLVAKYGDKNTLTREISNYENYVDGYIRWHATAKQDKPLESTNLGLNIYSVQGDVEPEKLMSGIIPKISTFEDFYRDHNSNEIRDFLETLFKINCKKWYTEEVETLLKPFATTYRKALKLTTSSLNTVEDCLEIKEIKRIFEINTNKGIGNPIIHARHQNPSMFTQYCRTHGDLNARNIIVQDGKPFLIDFSHTGYGPIYRDLVKMEASIKFELLKEEDLEARFEMENILLNNDDIFEVDVEIEKMSLEIEKAYLSISTLRQLAKEISPLPFNKEAYFLGLYYTTLKNCDYLAGDNKKNTKLAHALISAGMICKRLLDEGIFEELLENESLLFSDDPLAPEEMTRIRLPDILEAIREIRDKQDMEKKKFNQLYEMAYLYFSDYEGFKDQVKGKSWRVWHLKKGYHTKNAMLELENVLSEKGISLSQFGIDIIKISAEILEWIQKKSILANPDEISNCKKGYSEPILVNDICLINCEYSDGCEVKINQRLL
ncbi:response regulator [Candidatus Pacearchaeota archaeon]|nr:response regulator [Candidatus Pacearchaeota archaeon]